MNWLRCPDPTDARGLEKAAGRGEGDARDGKGGGAVGGGNFFPAVSEVVDEFLENYHLAFDASGLARLRALCI